MDGCHCSYCGKFKSWDKLIDFGFYLIGDYACKKCAKERIKLLQTEIIPQIIEEIKML